MSYRGTSGSVFGGVWETLRPVTEDEYNAAVEQASDSGTPSEWWAEGGGVDKSGGSYQQEYAPPSGGASTVAMSATSGKNWFDELPTAGKIALVGGAAVLLYFVIK